jgi:FMN phosphatase YigB (HAD superfamily)
MATIIFDLDETLYANDEAHEQAFQLTAAEAARRRDGIHQRHLAEDARRQANAVFYDAPETEPCRRVGTGARDALWTDHVAQWPLELDLQRWAAEYQRSIWYGALERQAIFDWGLATHLAETYATVRSGLHPVYDDAGRCSSGCAPMVTSSG